MQRPSHRMPSQGQKGFTLIEVTVAMALMAMVAALSWRGLDALLQAHERTRQRALQHAVVQTAMMQWQTDLDQLVQLPVIPAIDWNGKVLRLTRAAARTSATEPARLLVVAWSERNIDGQRQWLRWQSQPVFSRQQWAQAWETAARWAQGHPVRDYGSEVVLLPIHDWRLYFSREGRWVNPLSHQGGGDVADAPPVPNAPQGEGDSGDAPPAAAYAGPRERADIPDAVRLQLDVASGAFISGLITRDWLNPTFGANR
ncbi:PulJ/GspJ family protein [Lampropedia cohaerens]|nr:prepilin-type N-terminal cleavage/methylation domain-containing protein [Lampropedia cohaerens]